MDALRKRFMFDAIAADLLAIGAAYRDKPVAPAPALQPISIRIVEGVADAPAEAQPLVDGRREDRPDR